MKYFYIADQSTFGHDPEITKLELDLILGVLKMEGLVYGGILDVAKTKKYYKGHRRPVVIVCKDFIDVEGSVIQCCDGFWSFVHWIINNHCIKC